MKGTLLVLVLLPCMLALSAQSTFINTYDTKDKMANEGRIVVEKDGKIHVFQISVCENAFDCVRYAIYNEQGMEVYEKTLPYDTKTSINCYFDREMKRYSTLSETEECDKPVTHPTSYSHHVVDPTKEWNTILEDFFSTRYARWKFSPDSIKIGSYYYSNLLTSSDSTGNNWMTTSKYGRNDGAKFWMRDSSRQQEYLLMDMSLVVGDIHKMMEETNGGDALLLKVTEVDSIAMIDGSLRKRITLVCNFDIYPTTHWVEGIGNLRGAFDAESLCYLDVWQPEITCYYENGDQVYQSDIYQCWGLTATDDLLEPTFTIFPNPGSSSFDIVIPEQAILPLSYELKSITGAKMLSGSHDNYEPMHVDTDALTSGVYVIEIRGSNGNVWQQKWICHKE